MFFCISALFIQLSIDSTKRFCENLMVGSVIILLPYHGAEFLDVAIEGKVF